jgi:hypothetical protein
MDNKEKILELYFLDKLKTVEIEKILNVSQPYVTKVIKQDERYTEEKERRKAESKDKKAELKKLERQRASEENMRDYAMFKAMHKQAVKDKIETSRSISNRAMRDCNTSAYEWDNRRKGYKLNNKNNYSYAMPKFVKY